MRVIGSFVGLALFAAAVWVVASHWSDIATSMQEAARARWWTIPTLIILPWLSCALAAAMYHQLLNRDDPAAPRVAYREGLAVIACTWLMNYLPARPGMFGRLAYHKIVNDMPLKHSISMSIVAVTCAGASVLLLILVAIFARVLPDSTIAAAVLLPLPAALLAIVGVSLSRRELVRRYLFACAVRYLDVLTWLGRYLCAFAALGRPLALSEAVALTAISQAAMVVPLVSNGLGLREWAVGVLGPALPASMRSAPALSFSVSLTGDLLHRVADILAAVPAGLIGSYIVSRNLKAATIAHRADNTTTPAN
jgi:hypothetical protein